MIILKKVLLISAISFLGLISSCSPQAQAAKDADAVAKLTNIQARIIKSSYEIGEKINSDLNSNLSAILSYDGKSNQEINYSYFSDYNLGVNLFNPNNAKYDIDKSLNEIGTWKLTVFSTEDEKINDSVTINVNSPTISVENISINYSTLTLEEENTQQLKVTITPLYATNKTIIWSSSDISVATVSNVGLVSALKAGKTTISATSEDNGQTVTCEVTVKEKTIPVTSVSINKTSLSLNVDETYQLETSVLPKNATDKTIAFSTSNSSIAEVSKDGLITAMGSGSATITASASNNKKATCYVTITDKTSENSNWQLVTALNQLSIGDTLIIAANNKSATAGSLYNSGLSSVSSTFSSDKNYIIEVGKGTEIFTLGGTTGEYTLAKSNGDLLASSGEKKLSYTDGTTTWKITYTSGAVSIANTTSNYGTILYSSNSSRFTTYANTSNGKYSLQLYKEINKEPIDPTSISLSETSGNLSINKQKQLSITYTPSNANQNKDLTWASDNANVATVSNSGLVKVSEGANIGDVCHITASLTYLPDVPSVTYTLTVVETVLDNTTIMIYMCGSNLESEGGLATSDIKEILSVNNQPDDVNIIIETGGSKSWKTSIINANKLCRLHIENKQLVLDETLNYQSMGDSSTLQSFIEWGINEYPAERMGLIYWNHGGAMDGVCSDEKKDNDCLTNDECLKAYEKAFENTGRTSKLDWVGYDACLMSVQDVADYNGKYFNYMIASQESEAGEGWDYDNWIDNVYNYDDTVTTLKAIANSFCVDSYDLSNKNNDCTMSVLDLSKIEVYRNSWETMTTQLNGLITSQTQYNSLKSLIQKSQQFGYDSYSGYAFNVFDVDDFLINLKSSYPSIAEYANQTLSNLNDLIIHNVYGKKSDGACGLCFFFPTYDKSGYESFYNSSITNFINWANLCFKY